MDVLRVSPSALVLAIATVAVPGCKKTPPPPSPPAAWLVEGASLDLQYGSAAVPLRHDLEFDLTHTGVGLYVEATLALACEVQLRVDEDAGLRAQWSIQEVSTLTLEGSAEPTERDAIHQALTEHGRGATVLDGHGVLDLPRTEQTPANVERREAMAQLGGPASRLLLLVVEEQLRLPRLPDKPLAIGESIELEEESETVLADAGLVLPTTTVYRFTLERVSDIGIAELVIEHATVAEPDPELEGDATDGDAADDEPMPDPARMELRGTGTLMFDLSKGLPVSLALTTTQQFEVGDQEIERSLTVRSSYAAG